MSRLYDTRSYEKEVIEIVRFIMVDEEFKACDAKFEDLEINIKYDINHYRCTSKLMDITVTDVITIKHIPSQCYVVANVRMADLHNALCLILHNLGVLINAFNAEQERNKEVNKDDE